MHLNAQVCLGRAGKVTAETGAASALLGESGGHSQGC